MEQSSKDVEPRERLNQREGAMQMNLLVRSSFTSCFYVYQHRDIRLLSASIDRI